MSVPFSMVPMSRRYTVVPEVSRIGVLSDSLTFPPSAAVVRVIRSSLPVHMFPDAITREALLTAVDRFVGDTRLLLQLVGILGDDDRPLIPAEWPRSGHAGRGSEGRNPEARPENEWHH
jgi:hypothetical protein